MYLRSLSTSIMEKLISHLPFLIKVISPYYKEKVEKEISLAQIKESDKVLCIGGGAVPITAISINKKTGADVDVVDIDQEAVEKSRVLLKKLGLRKNIKVKLAHGQNIGIKDYSVIHVALQAEPHSQILENIFKQAENKNRVIIRCPHCSKADVYQTLDSYISEHRFTCAKEEYTGAKAELLFINLKGSITNEKDNPIYGSNHFGTASSLAG